MGKLGRWIWKELKISFCILLVAVSLYSVEIFNQNITLMYKEKVSFSYLTLEATTLERAIDGILKEMKNKCPANIPPELLGRYSVLKNELKYELDKTHTRDVVKLFNSSAISVEEARIKVMKVKSGFEDYRKIAKILAELLEIYKHLLIAYGDGECNRSP